MLPQEEFTPRTPSFAENYTSRLLFHSFYRRRTIRCSNPFSLHSCCCRKYLEWNHPILHATALSHSHKIHFVLLLMLQELGSLSFIKNYTSRLLLHFFYCRKPIRYSNERSFHSCCRRKYLEWIHPILHEITLGHSHKIHCVLFLLLQ